MVTVEQELIVSSPLDQLDAPAIGTPPTPEVITEASRLSQVHHEAYRRARPFSDTSGILTHEDDPSFRFVVGHFGEDQFIKLGNNGVSTLVYVIQKGKVLQHVSIGDTLTYNDDITDNLLEVAALANIIQKGI